jgi:hypothetical protein
MPENSQSALSYQPVTKGYSYRSKEASPASVEGPKPKQKAPEQKPEGTNPFLLLTLEVLGLVALFIVFVLVLNFFNIISLSSIYPKTLGLLPHLNQKQQTATNAKTQVKLSPFKSVTTPNPSLQKATANYDGSFAGCPVDIDQCKLGISYAKRDQGGQLQYGLEYKILSPNTNILAVIPGNLTTQNITQDGQNFLQINIENKTVNTRSQYLIPAEDFNLTASASSVTSGKVLGVLKNNPTLPTNALLLKLQTISTNGYMIVRPAKDGSGLMAD